MPKNVWLTVLLILASFMPVMAEENKTTENATEKNIVRWFNWSDVISLPDTIGTSGSFIGLTDEGILVAGGAKFSEATDAVYLLKQSGKATYRWQSVGKLPRPIMHGAAVATPKGLICLGGHGPEGASSEVFALEYSPVKKTVVIKRNYPPLPEACDYLAAARLGKTLYVAGGRNADGPMDNFWALDLSSDRKGNRPLTWRSLPAWPGPARFGAILIAQNDGDHDCLYFFGGKSSKGSKLAPSPATGLEKLDDSSVSQKPVAGDRANKSRNAHVTNKNYLTDTYRFDPAQTALTQAWQPVAPMPRPAFLAPATAWGQSHMLVLGGFEGEPTSRLTTDLLAYHTITDTWTTVGDLPQGVADTTAMEWNDRLILLGGVTQLAGEIQLDKKNQFDKKTRLGAGSSSVYLGTPRPIDCHFGLLDYAALTGYLAVLLLVGFYFTKREKTTSDFFLGGQRIPWWAAGLSLLATQVSSIGFMAIPAKAYATNWVYFAGVGTWFLIVPIVTRAYIPFFRRLNVTSAYEYLEVRFHLVVRLLGTVTYSLLQLGRMAIVLYLPAIALSVVTGMDKHLCIIVMGVLCTAYTVAGGIEAVIWTDVIQAVLLVGGALVCVGTILLDIEGGPAQFFEIAMADGKFQMADFSWGFATAATWVVLFGNAFTRLGSLTSDQAVVQRYLTTPDEKAACRALWTDVLTSVPWAIIIFTLGTALYVFYKLHPAMLSPTLDTDAIVPLFIVQKIPAGLSGLIVAAIFAAAMSSLDSAMHSVATIWVTDFYARFKPDSPDHTRLKIARWITLLLGVFGTVAALWMASTDIHSLWDSFQTIIGLFIGGLAALFALGIFTRRAHALGAIIGLATSVVVLYVVIHYSQIHFFLYSGIGFLCCYVVGYIASLILHGQSQTAGVTIYTLKQDHDS